MSWEVMARIRESLDDCPPAEQRVGVALLGNGPAFGLRSSGQLAAAVGTSQPSVIRFIQRVGFGRYSEFQAALRESLGAEEAAVPVETSYAGQVTGAITDTLALSDTGDAVRTVCRAGHVWATGGTATHLAAHYLVNQLQEKRQQVTLVGRDSHERAVAAAQSGRRDAVVVFDYPPYEPDTLRFAALCRDRGAAVVLFTDQGTSPIGPVADVTLRTSMVPLSGGDSLVPVFALIDELALDLTAELGRSARRLTEAVADSLARLRST